MGMSAEVLAIGPSRSALVPVLEHPAERYATTREGARLVEQVFNTAGGSFMSHEFAKGLGIEAWDFNTHALDPQRIRYEALETLLGSVENTFCADTRTLKALHAAGFQLCFHLRAQ